METKGGLMTKNSFNFFTAISRPKAPESKVRMICGREHRQSVNATMFSNPVASLDVIRMCVLGDPGSLSLLGRKIPLLPLGDLIETASGF